MPAIRQGLRSTGARTPVTEFRSSMTTPQGLHKTDVFLGRVIGVDYNNWTIDFVSQFDQMRILQIAVASPYQHSTRGEGMYVMPEVGSKCAVCWPGDSSPPFVLGFIMPHEVLFPTAEEDAPQGTADRADESQSPATASFAGGRPRAKGGDMVWRGRDGNQVVLHRGGVLQIGANELSQRIYIPLRNLIMDFCENYELQNSGGSIKWGIQEGEGEKNLPSSHTETFRVFANDKYADIRISSGKVQAPVPDSDTGISGAEVGASSPIVYEFAFSKGGFRGENGALNPSTATNLKLRFVFDRDGNSALRIDGNVYIRCKKKLVLKVDDSIEIQGGSSMNVSLDGGFKLTTSSIVEIAGAVTKINGGSNPVARPGDSISVTLPIGTLMAAPTPVGFAPIPPPLLVCTGVIVGPGSQTVLVP